ncbi:unnamed protein product [Closterium sp. NIES-54]
MVPWLPLLLPEKGQRLLDFLCILILVPAVSPPRHRVTGPLGRAVGMSEWSPLLNGPPGTTSFCVTLEDASGREVSPWHDVPLHSTSGGFHLVCTTPKGTQVDCHVAVQERLAPLRHRVRAATAAVGGGWQLVQFNEPVPWNCGVLPQTWSDGAQRCAEFGNLPFDDSPIEMVEIGRRVRSVGEVYSVGALAVFALVDPRGLRLSWKVVGIALDDDSGVVDSQNGSVHILLDSIQEWLHSCRAIRGERGRVLRLKEGVADKDKVLEIVAHAHAAWQLLRAERQAALNPRMSMLGLDDGDLSEEEELARATTGGGMLAGKVGLGPPVRIFGESYASDIGGRRTSRSSERGGVRTLGAPVFGSSLLTESWDSEEEKSHSRQQSLEDDWDAPANSTKPAADGNFGRGPHRPGRVLLLAACDAGGLCPRALLPAVDASCVRQSIALPTVFHRLAHVQPLLAVTLLNGNRPQCIR